MTEYLTPLDASYLHMEDADRHANLGFGALAVLEGPIPEHAALMSALGERIAACPRFAQRLRRRPWDLVASTWVPDPTFCLANHVCRIAAPGRGTDDELFAVVGEVMSWRLDRNRPLWEIWVIDGLSDGRWAMLVKVHPSIADAAATVHILAGLSDEGPAHGAGHGGAAGGRRSPTGWQHAVRMASSLAAGARNGVQRADQAVRGAAEFATGLLRPATALNGPLSSRRRYTAARVNAAEVDQICRTFEVTVDDVALAALTESYRNLLIRRGSSPEHDSLRTLVPAPEAVLLPRLPIDEDNPVTRLRIVHARLAQARAAADGAGSAAAALARAIPPPVTAWATTLISRLPQRSVVALAANVPGPGRPLTVLGCPVSEILPIPPIGLQLRTAAAILRYDEDLFFGILADYGSIRDADELARGVEAAVARLLARSRARRGARDRHGLSLVVNV
ncbi:wax ester/triacylglycerol synthase family O-acyltransferase [Mycolicibacter minnesotensis]